MRGLTIALIVLVAIGLVILIAQLGKKPTEAQTGTTTAGTRQAPTASASPTQTAIQLPSILTIQTYLQRNASGTADLVTYNAFTREEQSRIPQTFQQVVDRLGYTDTCKKFQYEECTRIRG